VKFIFDANISYRIAATLAAAFDDEHQIESIESYFGKSSLKDAEFLPVLRQEGGWIILTADMGKKDGDWHVWLASGLTTFFLRPGWTGKHIVKTEMLSKLFKYWPRIVKEAAVCREGTCFWLATNGTIIRVPRKSRKDD
jgi:hypothetical protein